MIIPDCRTDESYNQKYLNEKSRELVTGYNFAIEDMLNIFDNLLVYMEHFDIDGEDINLVRFLLNHEEVRATLIDCMKDWAEMNRNEIIVSLLEDQDDFLENDEDEIEVSGEEAEEDE